MNPSNSPVKIALLTYVLTASVIMFFCAYTLFTAYGDAQNTGILHITANKSDATLSVSQAGHEAMIVGVDKASIRLSPGVYHVAASHDGTSTTATTQVGQQQTTTINLDFSKAILLPSVQSINFQGTDALVNSGITTSQIGIFKLGVFTFKKSAKVVVVDRSSVQPAPHNPAVDGGTFKTNFVVKIDAKRYNATLAYSGLDAARLTLSDPLSSALVFDSGIQ